MNAKSSKNKNKQKQELWLSRIKQIFLEYQNATELLDDRIEQLEIAFYDYKTEIDFDKKRRSFAALRMTALVEMSDERCWTGRLMLLN